MQPMKKQTKQEEIIFLTEVYKLEICMLSNDSTMISYSSGATEHLVTEEMENN